MTAPQRDYHVHYFVDGCAGDEMTLAGIEAEALRLGLEEICVLKHYSREMPNGEATWAYWKRIIPEQFEDFLKDIRGYQRHAGLPMLCGVESEIVDDKGRINISGTDADRLDAVVLSVHWLPLMDAVSVDPSYIPFGQAKCSATVVSAWFAELRRAGVEAIVENLVLAYVNAIAANPKVCVLGHMYDGLLPLRTYGVPVDDLPDAELVRLMEPLMHACVRGQVVWELKDEPVERPCILIRANELGVTFCATADAHNLALDAWGNLAEHHRAEEYISSCGLQRGSIRHQLAGEG
jgi:histidinol phosphatase-like PHP family hydrolase